ncbi:hypothetical protein FALBO_16262 [Fusarium albosuccineum]|uniref:Uncharacterized protein n=1 Tax=Fusarium albosuccineum TaxID=1237068 RepID=A0A8H4NY01_9HYPO|nr:hypothetical protein FALBO_16262 [Fusarium albosuccineum]
MISAIVDYETHRSTHPRNSWLTQPASSRNTASKRYEPSTLSLTLSTPSDINLGLNKHARGLIAQRAMRRLVKGSWAIEAVDEVGDADGEIPIRLEQKSVVNHFPAQGLKLPARGWDKSLGDGGLGYVLSADVRYARDSQAKGGAMDVVVPRRFRTSRVYKPYRSSDGIANSAKLVVKCEEAGYPGVKRWEELAGIVYLFLIHDQNSIPSREARLANH